MDWFWLVIFPLLIGGAMFAPLISRTIKYKSVAAGALGAAIRGNVGEIELQTPHGAGTLLRVYRLESRSEADPAIGILLTRKWAALGGDNGIRLTAKEALLMSRLLAQAIA